MCTEALPIVLKSEPRAKNPIIKHVFLVSVLDRKPCHVPLNCSLIKRVGTLKD